jgi:hypothetical protein
LTLAHWSFNYPRFWFPLACFDQELVLDVNTLLVPGLPFISPDFNEESSALFVWGSVGVDCGFCGVLEFDSGAARTLDGNGFQESSPKW